MKQVSNIPECTTTERNALTSVPTNTIIFNITTGQPEIWNGSSWVAFPASSGGTVTSVTGSGNIASSGGTTPNITFTGTLPIANGGTNNGSLSVAAGTVYYGDGTKLVGLAPGTTGQILQSNGSSAPTWVNPSTASAPSTFIALDTMTGAWGTGTKIILWTNAETTGAGSDLSRTSSSSDDYITVLTAGNYSVLATVTSTGNMYFGITKNAASGDPNTAGNYANTNIYSIPPSSNPMVRLGMSTQQTGTGQFNNALTYVGYFNVNDRIRIQSDITPNSNTNAQWIVNRIN